MFPTQQGFEADHLVGLQSDERLVMDNELSPF